MSRRGARLVVAVLFAVVCGAAAWHYAGVERSLASRTDQAATFERDARMLVTAIAELRGAQQGYVAAGQGTDYWTMRAGKELASVRTRVDALRQRATDSDAAARLNQAAALLDRFSRLDARAREYVAADQRLLASDLIYGEGFETLHTTALEIDGARAAQSDLFAAAARRMHVQQQWLAAGVPALGLFFLMILAFVPGAQARPAAVPPVPSSTRVLDLTPEAEIDDDLGRALDQSLDFPSPAPGPSVDLAAAAELCVDLARVRDTDEIPALLERAAHVLDARGIVLWMGEPDGRELVPTVAHGYPAAAVARLGTIPRDSDNATAAAFREGRTHTVKGDMVVNGAIVVPLVTTGGCVGVMAAELRNEREQRDEVRAVASILAAQLATLIGVTPVAQPHAQAN